MTYLFKVWSADRKQKISILIHQSENMLSELITKSNAKLGITGSILVMEKDGTVVDDNDVLQYCSTETFMLLQSEEFWSSQNETELHSTASCDTVSLTSSLSESVLSVSSNPSYVSSPTNVSHIKRQSDNEEIWTNFCIPWNSLEPAVLKELELEKRNKYIICCCK